MDERAGDGDGEGDGDAAQRMGGVAGVVVASA